jgi:hypothetical protein
MTRPTIDEIRKMKDTLWSELDRTKNKEMREGLSNRILILQWVLDERP